MGVTPIDEVREGSPREGQVGDVSVETRLANLEHHPLKVQSCFLLQEKGDETVIEARDVDTTTLEVDGEFAWRFRAQVRYYATLSLLKGW